MITDELFLQIVQAMTANNGFYLFLGIIVGWFTSSMRSKVAHLEGIIHGLSLRLPGLKKSEKGLAEE